MLLDLPKLPAYLLQAEPSRLPWTFEVEGQIASFGRNDVGVPGGTGTVFDIRDLNGRNSFIGARLSLTYEREEGGPGYRLLYAPLRRTGTGVLPGTTLFDGATFAGGVPTRGVYQFNGYRATYRNRIRTGPRSDWRIGLTVIVVDAEYALSQGATSRSFTSVGVVPLFHIYGEERLGNRLAFNLDFDGWGVSQGRAFDVGLRLLYDTDARTRIFAGVRFLDGGVNVNTDYNSVFATYALAGVQLRF